MIEALGSSIPKTTFVPLVAGWEEFNKNGKALPDDTVRYVSHSVRGGSQPFFFLFSFRVCDSTVL